MAVTAAVRGADQSAIHLFVLDFYRQLWRSNTRTNETGGIVFYDIHAGPRDVRDSTEVLAAIMSRIVITATIDESNGTPRAGTVTRTDVVAWPD
jgi:hypothetical protein